MEDFVTFEIAKKLKEKGFREKCLFHFRPYSKTLHPNNLEIKFNRVIDYTELLDCNNVYIDNDIDAPTISQVLKWLREKMKIHITTGYNNVSKWRYIIIHLDDNFAKYPNIWEKHFESYEEATLSGIEYVIDNLI